MDLTSGERLALLCGLVSVLSALALSIVYRMKVTPAERERRRRLKLNQLGRLGDAVVTDVVGDTLYFSYSLHGVSYNASQDISCLRTLLPEEPSRVIGPVWIKYLPRNPANSIVLCEHWSGLRPNAGTQVPGEAAPAGPAV